MELVDFNGIYFELQITADSPATKIWLADDGGHLVQKEVGELRTSLMPGAYVVEFGLGTVCYPIDLKEDTKYTQRELKAGPSCERPVVRLPDDQWDNQ